MNITTRDVEKIQNHVREKKGKWCEGLDKHLVRQLKKRFEGQFNGFLVRGYWMETRSYVFKEVLEFKPIYYCITKDFFDNI